MSRILALSAAVLAACGGAAADVPYSFTDTGRVCLSATADPGTAGAGTFAADAPVFVQFDLVDTCFSSCLRDKVVTCEVTRADGAIAVTSQASWIDISPSAEVCTAECAQFGARCQLGPVPAGTYTVRYGTQALTLTVPSQAAAAPCLTAAD